jgi:glycosyltransferase involved in cell wall biosynthesis
VITSIPSFLNFAEPADYSIFVSPEDPDQMADAICFLAGHPDEAERLAHRGIEVASRYSFKKVAGNIERTLRMEYIRRLCPNWLHALYRNLDMKKKL